MLILMMVQDCRTCFGGAIGRMMLRESWRRRFYPSVVRFPIFIFGVWGGKNG